MDPVLQGHLTGRLTGRMSATGKTVLPVFTLLKGDSQGCSQGVTGRCTYFINPHCDAPFGVAQGDPRFLIHLVQENSVHHSVDQTL